METSSVLVVDDHAEIRLLVRLSLEGENIVVYEAGDAEEALRVMRDKSPAVVVLDLMLPGGVDGIELGRMLREDANLGSPRVIMLSARSSTADVERAMDAGIETFIVKPFSPAFLASSVAAMLPTGDAGE